MVRNNVSKRMQKWTRSVLYMLLVLSLILPALPFFVQPAAAANPAPQQTYYISIPEDDLLQMFDDNSSNTITSPIRSITGISIGSTGTLVYYDQWEDGGYDADIANPGGNVYANPGNLDGTQIWGDSDLTNGCPPNLNNVPNPCLAGTDDSLAYGDVIILDNDVVVSGSSGSYSRPTSPPFFDGRDKFGATFPVAVTRGLYPVNTTAVLAGGVEVLDTGQWGTSYEAPLGEDTLDTNTESFEDVRWFIMAGAGGATIDVDANGDGDLLDANDLNDWVMAEGAKRFVNGILEGATLLVVSGNPVQVNSMTHDTGSTYEARWDALIPRPNWTNNYYTPVGTQPKSGDAACTEVEVYNPNTPTNLGNYRDEFASQAYNLSVGSILWSTSWTEENDDNSATTGTILIELTAASELRVGSPSTNTPVDDAIYRQADLSSATGAIFSYSYRDSAGGSGDAVAVEVRNPPGAWQNLATIDGDSGTGSNSHNISAYIANDTQIRFRVSSTLESGDEIYFDNVNIALTSGTGTITINYDFPGGLSPDGSFTVASKSTATGLTSPAVPSIPYNNGARFWSQGGEPFLPISVTDCTKDTSGGGQAYDWGTPLYPVDQLTSELLVGWAPGCTNESLQGICNDRDQDSSNPIQSRNVVFVTALSNTTIYVDKDGSGISCPAGTGAEQTIAASALASYRIHNDPTARYYVRDNFDTAAYTNNSTNSTETGTSQTWGGNWIETGDDGSPTAGDILITGSPSTLRLRGASVANMSIERQVNLSGMVFAGLTFSLASSGNLDANDDLAVDISNDGGTTWRNLKVYEDDPTTSVKSIIISDYLSANTRVRFRAVDALEAGNYWNIDDVQITYAPDGDYDMTGARLISCDGVQLAAAWGQDPALMNSSVREALDMGSIVPPFGTRLVLEKSADYTEVDPGQLVTYTFAVKNYGSQPLNNVTVTDNKCSPTYSSGDTNSDGKLAPLGAETWLFTCTANIYDDTTNVAYASGVTDGGRNVISAPDEWTVIVRAADVQVGKTCPDFFADPVLIDNGNSIYEFTVTVTNNGPKPAKNVYFIDDLALVDTAGVTTTYHSYVGDGSFPSDVCTYPDPDGKKVKCALNSDLPSGQSWTVKIRFYVTFADINNTEIGITNSATAYHSPEIDPNLANNTGTCSATTPVTLAYFQVTPVDGRMRFDWTTAAEINTAGFNLYVQQDNDLVKLNPRLIPSQAGAAVDPHQYSVELPAAAGRTFYIEDVDIFGHKSLHGPYKVGEAHGNSTLPAAIDWAAVGLEHQAKTDARIAERIAAVSSVSHRVEEVSAPAQPAWTEATGKAFLPLAMNKSRQQLLAAYDLQVNQDGLYRVTYEALKTQGLDLAGVSPSAISLANQGQAVPVYVQSDGSFGPGAYFEFVGYGLDTLYTDTSVYQLKVNQGSGKPALTDNTAPGQGAPEAYYLETAKVHNNKLYNYSSPNGDPWLDTMMSSPYSGNFTINTDNYVASGPAPLLTVNTWGYSDNVIGDDHHLLVSLNNTQVANATFDGLEMYVVNANVPAGVLQNGANTMRLQLPGDTGADPDTVNLDRYSLTYPRAFAAVNGRLTFTSTGSLFQVSNLPSANVAVYRLNGGEMTRLTNLVVSGSGPYSIKFAGSGSEATYFIADASAMLTPASMLPGLPAANLTGELAQLLIVSHPDFAGSLGTLVAARQADGYSVKVVNVEDVYAQFGYGVFDPRAIKDYITFAAQNLGTTHVLLVGGDTYDYRNFGGTNSISFIPTIYLRTDNSVAFSPADQAYVDVTNDNLPDLAIGRFPVRTSAELDLIISKTLAYDSKNYGNTAVFSADNDYKADSEGFVAGLAGSWSVQKSYLDDTGIDPSGVNQARQILLNAMNGGVALASYVGHSGEYLWSFEGLFDTFDAQGLTNYNRPMVVTQWGCFNTYFVSPAYDTLGHYFMLSGNQGAAAVLGATTLSYSSSEKALGTLMFPYLSQPGMSIGEALQAAKAGIPLNQRTADIMMGWTILGDPTLVIQP